MKLSIVSTLYGSAPHLRAFYAAARQAAQELTPDHELVLVHDGSPDDSLNIALELQRHDPSVRIIDLSRNFGHHKAIMTGLAHARGDLVFVIDSDMEEPPGVLATFHEALQANHADVAYGVQRARKGGTLERVGGDLFYSVFNALSDVPLPRNLVVARLMTRRYVDSLLQYRERELVIAGLWEHTGFKQVAVLVDKASTPGSTYSLRRRIEMAVRAVTMFSNKPLVWISYLGAAILAISSAYILYLLSIRIFIGRPPDGYTSLMVSLWFLGGLIVFCLGIIAIYLSVIFVEVKQRPLTVVRDVHEGRPPGTSGSGARGDNHDP
jgi:putative glycosyltransferase